MATAIELKSKADAQKILDEHVESTAGTCVECFKVDGVAVMAPCFHRIEAARFMDRSGNLPV